VTAIKAALAAAKGIRWIAREMLRELGLASSGGA